MPAHNYIFVPSGETWPATLAVKLQSGDPENSAGSATASSLATAGNQTLEIGHLRKVGRAA